MRMVYLFLNFSQQCLMVWGLTHILFNYFIFLMPLLIMLLKNFFSNCSLLVYNNWFLYIDLAFCKLSQYLIIFCCYFCTFLRIHNSTNKDSFTSSFLICFPFIYFSHLLGKNTPDPQHNVEQKLEEKTFLGNDFREEAFRLSPLKMILVVGFSSMSLIRLRKSSSFLVF